MTFTQYIAGRVSNYMRQAGFTRKRKLFYKIINDIAYCIEFDSPGGILYTAFYILPLYIPADTRYYSYGNRLNTISPKPLSLLRTTADSSEIKNWCEEFYCTLDRYVFPLFDRISSPQKLLSYLKELSAHKILSVFFCQPYLLERLKLYTFLYQNDIDAARCQLNTYRQAVLLTTTLITHVKDDYLHEADQIEDICFLSSERRMLFFRNTITDTTQKCID